MTLIGQRVQERLAAAGLSQAELARRVGVSQPTIFNLIHRSKKGSTKLHAVARELGTTPAYLSGETDDPLEDAPPEPELSREERELLDCYRALGGAQKAALFTIAMSMAGQGPAGSVNAPALSYRPD
ncbi:transcriptional regulator with XRE-family HTH domain [Sphingomonas jejuensis]|uniref:Transcriptional regulator with XRE-family HTH domain n=1 Tax=Sphingomonas jejuensis TaxID=904715 RepID=A0ABX0XMA3_9SPHN|nr:helix-turn-helix transcriptional regulator [Sphingomonas jejuensis]NJC33887.1 transcriptional regulator with XRE-family HTH domain [Sphingomonas jejuensis]